MYSGKKIIAIIPGRGGSKGIPRKTIKPLAGKPLIAYAINSALSSKYIDKVLVTSEDDEILLTAKKYGADIYKRPKHLSNDETTLDDVIYDAIKNLQGKYDIAITIQPTSPLIRAVTIDSAIKELVNKNKDSVISLQDKIHLYWKEKNKKIVPDFTRRVNRQYLDKTYAETGAIIGAKTKYIIKNKTRINPKSICFIITTPEESADIDDYNDWNLVKTMIEKKNIGINIIGSKKIGTGHIYRQLTIAFYLDVRPTFFIKENQDLAIQKIKESHYPLVIYKTEKELIEKIKECNISIYISDALDTKCALIKKIKSNNIRVITFEDLGDGTKEADVSINALYELSNAPENMYFGYKYVCLRPDVLFSDKKIVPKNLKNILITCGGVDENDLTQKFLAALKGLDFKGSVKVVLGRGYKKARKLQGEFKKSGLKIEYYQDIPEMASFILWADLALTSNGRTVYEIASIGVPCIAICQNYRETKHTFSDFCGCISNLGLAKTVSTKEIAKEIKKYYSFKVRKKTNKEMLELRLEDGTKRVLNLINKTDN